MRHEPLDVSMKLAAIVISGGGERDEVLGRLRTLLAVQLKLEVTHVTVQCYRHGEDDKILAGEGESENFFSFPQ